MTQQLAPEHPTPEQTPRVPAVPRARATVPAAVVCGLLSAAAFDPWNVPFAMWFSR